jgi:hypothetical protein
MNTGLNDASSEVLSNQSFYCMVRSGLEFVRLWKQYCSTFDYPVLLSKLDEFTGYSIQIFQRLPDPIILHTEKNPPAYENSCVVLYFDHLFHGTPEGHVESQARIQTCLKYLRQQSEQKNSTSSSSSGDKKLVLTECNSIISPPLWVLPLVHSPQYLGELWKLALEATREDLFVPLEFDSEVPTFFVFFLNSPYIYSFY